MVSKAVTVWFFIIIVGKSISTGSPQLSHNSTGSIFSFNFYDSTQMTPITTPFSSR